MDYRHLKYFLEVASQKSFSKAARNLHISQSAISRMIKSLEDEIGVTLFIRNAKTVELTAPGTIFLNYAKRCVFSFEHLKSDFENEFNLKQDTIEIGLPPITDAHVFAKLLGEFKKNYPQIEIKLYEHGSKIVESSVQEGIIDVGIICTIPNKDFESFFLSNDDVCVVMPRECPLVENKTVPMKLLADYPLVLYRDDFNMHDDILNTCSKIGFAPKVVFETSQRELMIQTVSSGLGVALLPSRLCPKNSDESGGGAPSGGTGNDPSSVCDLEEGALPVQSGPAVDRIHQGPSGAAQCGQALRSVTHESIFPPEGELSVPRHHRGAAGVHFLAGEPDRRSAGADDEYRIVTIR